MAASAAAHALVLGLLVTAPADRAVVVVEPLIVRLEIIPDSAPPGEAWPGSPVEPAQPGRPAQPVSRVESTAITRPASAELTAASTVDEAQENGGPDQVGGDGAGFESRWRVAPRGRGPLPQQALKPDCSISNPDHVWTGRDRYCGPPPEVVRAP